MNGKIFNDALFLHADRQLVRRSRWSAILYPVIFVLVVAFTPYWSDHAGEIVVMGSIIVLGALVRTVLVTVFGRWYGNNPRSWRITFFSSTFMLAAAWGVLCMLAIVHYQLQWTAMLVLLATAGIAAVAVTTLSIYYFLVVTFLILLLSPSVVAMLLLTTQESVVVMTMFLIFSGILLVVGRRLSKEYWQALENTFLLDQRARELEDSNKELESYSYSIAHDLRTPLRSMTAFSQILHEDASEKLSDEEKDHLRRIINAGHYMAELIDDILDLSRITRINLRHTRVNISGMANECLHALQTVEPGRSVEFNVEPDIFVNGDSKLLHIVLTNLLNNAWKFTSQREKTEISVGMFMDGTDQVVFVKDNGIGFDMRYADKIFGIFQRLNRKEVFEGTGIGLASVQRVINRHGGKVWANAKENEGATFYFSIP